MRIVAAMAVGGFLQAALPYAQEEERWADFEDPRVTGRNQLPPRATLVICPDRDTALRIGPVSNVVWPEWPGFGGQILMTLNGACCRSLPMERCVVTGCQSMLISAILGLSRGNRHG